MRRTMLSLLLAALAMPQLSAAEDSGWCLGAGVGLADTGDDSVLAPSDVPLLTGSTQDNDTSWGFVGGYRFNRYIALELGYVDLGEITSEVTDATGASDARAAVGFSADGFTLALIGTFPIGKWEPYIKAGAFTARTELEVTGSFSGEAFGGRTTEDDQDALYGIGLKYAISDHLQIYLDSTYFHEVGEHDTGQSDYLNTSIGASWRF